MIEMHFMKDDVIFFGKAESIHMMEYVCKVDYYNDMNNTVSTTCCMTAVKQPMPNNIMNIQEIPSMGIISTFDRLEDKKTGTIIVNLNNFDVYGLVKDSKLIERLDIVNSGIMLDKVTDEELEMVADESRPKLKLI